MAGIATGAIPATAASPLKLVAGPTRLEFFPGGPSSIAVNAWVSGGSAAQVLFTLNDAVISPQGGFQDADYGATPNSLAGFLTLTSDAFSYRPSDQEQRFTTQVSVDTTRIDRPRYGSLTVTVLPELEAGNEASVTAAGAVALQVLAAPSEATLEQLPATTLATALDSVGVQSARPWTLIDRLLPDLPRVVNHGPVIITATGSNTGSVVLDHRITYEFHRVSPWVALTGDAAGAPLYRVENVPRYLLAGQAFEDSVSSVIDLDAGPLVDSLPLIGFVRVRATSTGAIAGLDAPPSSATLTFVVFPWKESVFVFVVWLFQREWRHRKGRKVTVGDAPPIPTLRTRIREWLRRAVPSRPPAGE